MTELDDGLRELRAEYLSEVPARLADLRHWLAELGAGESGASVRLARGFHQLAGSGGSYGYSEISTVARTAEQFLRTEPAWNAETLERLNQAIDRLAEVVAVHTALLGQTKAFHGGAGFRVQVEGNPGALRDSIAELLTDVGLEVTADGGSPEEISECRDRPPSQWPDLVIILDDPASREAVDPFLIAAAWSDPRAVRPRSIVLVQEASAAGALEPIPGIDASFSPSAARQELPVYASTVARVGSPPFQILVVESDLDQAQLLTAWLETIAMRITHAGTAAAAEQVLTSGGLDLVVLGEALPDADSLQVAQRIRNRGPGSDLPLVVLADESVAPDRLEALRAAGNAVLRTPLTDRQGAFLHLVITNAERGRQLRRLAYRDGLTGVLNHAALLVAVERAMELARRRGLVVSLCTIALQDLASLNAQHGPLLGDQVLVHVADVLRSTVRGGDLIGRVSGPTFGVVALRERVEDAGVLAQQIQAVCQARPARVAAADPIVLRTSVGVACDPDASMSAQAMMERALDALARAKAGGATGIVHAPTQA